MIIGGFYDGWKELTRKCGLFVFFEYIEGLNFRMKSTHSFGERAERTHQRNQNVVEYSLYPKMREGSFKKRLPLVSIFVLMITLFIMVNVITYH